MFYGQPFICLIVLCVVFQLRPFTVHNVFPCFYGPNKVIILLLLYNVYAFLKLILIYYNYVFRSQMCDRFMDFVLFTYLFIAA